MKTPIFLSLRVEALEDLHTGSGMGSGDVDALVQRDRHNLPVIRASSLKGLLRKIGEELVSLQEEKSEKQSLSKELDTLLGSQKHVRSALRMTSLHVPKDLQNPTLIWGSTQYQENSRVPKEDTLRFIEYVAAGTHFEATIRLADSHLRPLLERLLNRMDRIGGQRNRGGGLVKVSFLEGSAVKNPNTACKIDTKCKCVRLLLKNLEPLCLPMTGYPGNLIRSSSFIRGQMLLGALMAWAIENGSQYQDLTLFQRLSVGDALPLPEGQTTLADTVLPIPLSMQIEKPKANKTNLPWWAVGSSSPNVFDGLGEERETEEKTKEKTKRPGAHDYLCRAEVNDPWTKYTPTISVRLRNATPEEGTGKDPELFSMEEIAENTLFQTELRFENHDDAYKFKEKFLPLLSGKDWLAVGREGRPMVVECVSDWEPSSSKIPISKMPNQDWVLTLTSDLILRGEYLGFLDDLDIQTMCELAGVQKQVKWGIAKSVVETEPVYGFNANSGLPRAPMLALRRGSCWKVSGNGSHELAKKLLKKEALGERTQEGFGRFLIDAQPVVLPPLVKKSEPVLIQNRSEALFRTARELAGKIKGKHPSVSQLQGLRERALAAENLEQLKAILDEIETAPDRRLQGGKAWSDFPVQGLREALGNVQNPDKKEEFDERRQLISHLVQWWVLFEREQKREQK